MAKRKAEPGAASGYSQLRIVGGAWRGRRIRFPAVDGLRPTPDRVRETLFNWLHDVIPGAACLDLFAGSGGLGFEALSRGAGCVVMVDAQPATVDNLRRQARELPTAPVEIVLTDAMQFLRGNTRAFDVIFLDPPFERPIMLAEACQHIIAGDAAKPGAMLYLESPAAWERTLPAGWQMIRSKKAGQVGYHLAKRRCP